MSLSKSTQSWKSRYYLLLLLFLGGLGTLGYFYGCSYWQGKKILTLDQNIKTQEEKVEYFYQHSGFREFTTIKTLETSQNNLPWSEYVERILDILNKIKEVEGGKGKVILSDFKVTLQELSLNGVVSRLKTLYTGSTHSASLLENFNQLEFLKDITIRNYEKNDNNKGFKFTLSAKIANNATKSTDHQ